MVLLVGGIRMGGEEERESEENAERDGNCRSEECEGEAEGSDPGAWKTWIHHFGGSESKRERVIVDSEEATLIHSLSNLKTMPHGFFFFSSSSLLSHSVFSPKVKGKHRERKFYSCDFNWIVNCDYCMGS